MDERKTGHLHQARLLDRGADEGGEERMRLKGRDFSSGWNCTPMNHGWSGISTISGNSPSGESPEKRKPAASSLLR